MTPRVLIIGGKKIWLEKAHALGLKIIYIQRKEKFDASHLAYVEHAVLTDFRDISALVSISKALYASFGFEQVISLTEEGLVPAAHVNDALGLAGNSAETATLLKDKWAMRQRLNALGISPVGARVCDSLDAVLAAVHDLGCPLVMKPVDGAGSLGIFRMNEPDDAAKAWPAFAELGVARCIVEEYLDGPEISVEGFTYHGRHVILGMTDKVTLPNHVEVGHSMPAVLSDELRSEVAQLVCATLDAVALREGPSHTEVKLTSRGPRIVESHNRFGGDQIFDLVRLVYGVDLEELSHAWPFGLSEAQRTSPAASGGAAVRFLVPPTGTVRELSGVDEARASEGVVTLELTVKVGDQVRPVKWSPDRSGFVVARGANVREAIANCERALAKIRVVTE